MLLLQELNPRLLLNRLLLNRLLLNRLLLNRLRLNRPNLNKKSVRSVQVSVKSALRKKKRLLKDQKESREKNSLNVERILVSKEKRLRKHKK